MSLSSSLSWLDGLDTQLTVNSDIIVDDRQMNGESELSSMSGCQPRQTAEIPILLYHSMHDNPTKSYLGRTHGVEFLGNYWPILRLMFTWQKICTLYYLL